MRNEENLKDFSFVFFYLQVRKINFTNFSVGIMNDKFCVLYFTFENHSAVLKYTDMIFVEAVVHRCS